MDRRSGDADQFIRPQREQADLVFALQPSRADLLELEELPESVSLKLQVSLGRGIYDEGLVRVLKGACGLQVEVLLSSDSDEVTMTLGGELAWQDVALAAKQLLPELDELLDLQPRWHDGMTGVMQLITVAQAVRSLRERAR